MSKLVIRLFIGCLFAFFGALASDEGGGASNKKITKTKQIIDSEQKTIADLEALEAKLVGNPEDAVKKLEQIIKFSIENNYQQALAKSYFLMGKAYKELQQAKLALHYMEMYEQSFSSEIEDKIAEESMKTEDNKVVAVSKIKQKESANSSNFTIKSNPQREQNYSLEMAEIHAILKNYSLSNDFYTAAKSKAKDVRIQKNIDYKIAENLYQLKQYEKALKLYESLLTYENTVGNEQNKSICNSRIAACHISLGDTDKGLDIYENSLGNSSLKASSNGVLKDNKEVVSKALIEQKKFKEEANLRSANLTSVTDGLEYLKLSQSYYKAGQLKQAEKSLDQYFGKISYNISDVKEIEVIEKMARVLQKQNKEKKALTYLFRYKELSDSVRNKLAAVNEKSEKIGASAYQNALELEALQKDKEISNNTIQHLVQEKELRENVVGFQKTLIYLLSFLSLATLLTTIYILRVSKQRRIANQQLAIRSLRSQMNPHFIFNALNSVNSFISLNDERSANKFLSDFSSLMRTVMENSEHDFIPLSKEIEILKLYLALEHFRFKDKFEYEFVIAENMDQDELQIPPMLIQPYIENAIWHGLRYKESKGLLKVSFDFKDKAIQIIIEDDGIGRTKSQAFKTKNQKKNKSTAIKNIDQRIELISALHKINVSVQIQDVLADGSGTKITLNIPQPAHA